MKEVNFLLIGMENFCCHIEALEIAIENGKMILISGPNGIGKTAVIQSLPFTLFGICEKGGGDDVVNNKTGKDCHTWTEFTIDKDHYRVDRFVKYKSIGNSVTITKNHAKKPYKKGQREVLTEIESLLLPRKLFTNTLLFAQKIKTFFTDLTDSEQKEIFRLILKLEEYLLYQKKATDKVKEVKETLDNIKNELEVNIQVQKDVDENIENQLLLMKTFEETKKVDLEELHIKLQNIIQEVSTIEGQVKKDDLPKLRSDLENVNKQWVLAKRVLEQIDSELEAAISAVNSKRGQKRVEFEKQSLEIETKINAELTGIEKAIRKDYDSRMIERSTVIKTLETEYNELSQERLRHEYQKDTHDKTISRNDTELVKKNEELTRLKSANKKGETCPTCQQDICDTHGIQERINQVDAEITEIIREVKVAEEGVSNEIQSINEIDEKIISNEQSRLKLESEIADLKSELTEEIHKETVEFDKRKLKNTQDLNGAKAKLDSICDSEIEKIKEAFESKHDDAMKEEFSLSSDRDGLMEHISEAESTIESLKTKENEQASIEKEIKEKVESTFDETSLESYKAKKKELIKKVKEISGKTAIYNKLLKILTFWKEGYSSSGIQSMLIDEAIPFMNHRASHYLDKLSKGRYSVSFDTMKATKAGEFRDKISVNVFDTMTHADSRTQLSGGQERIVDISTILTLSDLQSNIQSVSFNILLFDEIFDALDDANIEYVSKLLREVVGNKCMFIISHRHIDQIDADEQLSFH